jgi:hypothetical protein
MAQLSARVQADQFSNQSEVLDDNFIIDIVRGKWQIFEYSSEYTTTSGGFIKRGKVVRRYDPNAGDSEGKPARFVAKWEAVEYAKTWLKVK